MGSGRGRRREGKDAGNDGKIDHPASQGGAQFEEGATPWHADQVVPSVEHGAECSTAKSLRC
jgi:hypothetical protein